MGETKRWAAAVITTCTSAPRSIRRRTRSGLLYAAMPPVTPNRIRVFGVNGYPSALEAIDVAFELLFHGRFLAAFLAQVLLLSTDVDPDAHQIVRQLIRHGLRIGIDGIGLKCMLLVRSFLSLPFNVSRKDEVTLI